MLIFCIASSLEFFVLEFFLLIQSGVWEMTLDAEFVLSNMRFGCAIVFRVCEAILLDSCDFSDLSSLARVDVSLRQAFFVSWCTLRVTNSCLITYALSLLLWQKAILCPWQVCVHCTNVVIIVIIIAALNCTIMVQYANSRPCVVHMKNN